jgi:hypothetical protein
LQAGAQETLYDMSEKTLEGSQQTYLADHHLETLVKGSGISEEVIRARGYWTATDTDELLDLEFAKPQRRTPEGGAGTLVA